MPARFWSPFLPAAMLCVTASAAAAQTQPKRDTGQVPAVLPATIVAGRKIFHGVGGCLTCHGAKLEGTPIAPTLRAHKWRNGDGTLPAILLIISQGVHNTVMLSHPGGINDAQAKQVATYVWAVSQGKTEP